MKRTYLMVGVTALAFSVPALAAPRISDRADRAVPAASPPVVLAQIQTPGPPAVVATPPPGATVVIAPTAPPPPEAETPPPPPSPSYAWEPGHWSWNGAQFAWEPGQYVEKPTVSATYSPGHWQQNPNGWSWVPGEWDYPGVGSSLPPAPPPR
ncbi:MAG TPA: hypothetical protein VGM07_03545 [Stellaceae bacterium]